MKLIEAAEQLDVDLVEALLCAGSDAKFLHNPEGVWGSSDSKTALHKALEKYIPTENEEERARWREVVVKLVDAKADVNAVRSKSDWRGCGSERTAFELALDYCMGDAEFLRKFLDAGANPNTKSVSHTSSMRTDGSSESFVLHKAVARGNYDVVRTLLDKRAEVDAVFKERFHNERNYNRDVQKTSLHIALEKEDDAVAALLLKYLADPNKEREFTKHEEVAVTNPEAHDDPRAPDYEPRVRCVQVKERPLHIAIMSQHAAMAALLVSLGADPRATRSVGGVATDGATLCQGNEDLLRALGTTSWSKEWADKLPEGPRADADLAVLARIGG
jgi:hypothetical protein